MPSISRSPIRPLLFALFLTALASCAGKPSPAGSGFRDRDVLTNEQLNSVAYASAYEAIQALHSNWMRPRGVNSPTSDGMVWVILNDVRLGGIDTLRRISTQEIVYVRFYDAASAGARWGRDMQNGAIFVSTERP